MANLDTNLPITVTYASKSSTLKRGFDFIASIVGLIVLAPIFALIGLAIKLDSPGPIFYKAKRVGLDGRIFVFYKFRSMVANADKIGPGITVDKDKRVTRTGYILRRTKLDELPQLYNVLRGDMSLVGPRPEDPRYAAHYNDWQCQVLTVRPGITSPASIRYKNESHFLKEDNWEEVYIKQIMPEKLLIDLDYVQNANLFTDIKLILITILAIFGAWGRMLRRRLP